MNTSKERRLQRLELSLGVGKVLELPMIFIDSPLYLNEPDSLIIGASLDELTWDRQEGEEIGGFERRVWGYLRKIGRRGFPFLKRDHSGLPEPSESMPAYTSYADVIKKGV